MIRLRTLCSCAALLLVLSACDDDPGKGKAKAGVAAPQDTSAAAAAPADATFAFSNADSKVNYVGAKVSKKHDGSFETFKGTVKGVGNDPTKSTVTVEIDTASVTSDDEKLTTHLKSPDFFDVEKFPKARFTSTAIKAGGDKGASHTVTGNLELHGVTKSITFPATIKMSNDSVDVDAEFSINRKDFGIVYAGMADDLIKDEVLIKLEIRAKKSG
jgi:polyisoprenoid-binding protein YceI